MSGCIINDNFIRTAVECSHSTQCLLFLSVLIGASAKNLLAFRMALDRYGLPFAPKDLCGDTITLSHTLICLTQLFVSQCECESVDMCVCSANAIIAMTWNHFEFYNVFHAVKVGFVCFCIFNHIILFLDSIRPDAFSTFSIHSLSIGLSFSISHCVARGRCRPNRFWFIIHHQYTLTWYFFQISRSKSISCFEKFSFSKRCSMTV